VRAAEQASDIESLLQRLKLPRFSLGSCFEAAGVFDPALLAEIIEEIGECLDDIEPNQTYLLILIQRFSNSRDTPLTSHLSGTSGRGTSIISGTRRLSPVQGQDGLAHSLGRMTSRFLGSACCL